MNAFQAFGSVNGTLLASGLPLNATAPASPVKPAALPPVLLTAQATAGAQGDAATPPFTLTVTIPGYQDTLQFYACPPLLAGFKGTPITLAADVQAPAAQAARRTGSSAALKAA